MAERARILHAALEDLGTKLKANVLLLVSDREEDVQDVVRHSRLPFILATGKPEIRDAHATQARKCIFLHGSLSGSLNVLVQAKEILLGAILDGTIRRGDRVLCLITNLEALDSILFFDVDRDVELMRLREEMEGRVPMLVVERALRLASELAREGREGHPVGTLFVLGDAENVLKLSRQVVINPFKGHPEAARNLLDDALWETAKEFAQIDGAFVIREDGVVEAAGRYIDVDEKAELPSGLGGRHLAAASITRTTRAIAIVVSASGAIRVFKDGRMIAMLGTL